jgi:hypothetical protein
MEQVVDEPILDLFSHGQESLFDIGGILSRGLQEGNRKLIRKFLARVSLSHEELCYVHLCDRILNNLLTGQVRLVADKQFVHAFRRIPVNFL